MEINDTSVDDVNLEDDINLEETNETSEETVDYKAEAEKYKGIAQRYKTKLEKSQVKPAETKTEQPINKTNEPDYAKEAYLEQRGVQHSDDKKMIYDEAERLKMPLTDILGMDHIKSKLANAKSQRDALDGAPKTNGRSSGNTQNDVDYWLAKGETPSDLALAEKVIEARMNKEKNSSKFSDELYTG